MSGATMEQHDPRRGRWIPWVFAGGMLTVVAVNAVLVVAAVRTFPGLTVSQSYDRGRAYNQVLAEAARQDALGWRAEVALAPGGALSVAVTDREGLPVAGRLDGVLQRPVEGTVLPLGLAATAPGRWQAMPPEPAALRPGQWEVRLTLTGAADGQRLDIRRRVVVP